MTTKRSHTKKPVAKRAAKRREKPLPIGLVERAAERAGLKATTPPFLTPDEVSERWLASMMDRIVQCSDLVSEAMAAVEGQRESDHFDESTIRENLRDIHVALWRIRWEALSTGGQVTAKVSS